MAAYAALMSLFHTMDQVHQYAQHLVLLDKSQIESLYGNLKFLQDYLEKYSHGVGNEAEISETLIADAAYAAEDAFESHVLSSSTEPSSVLSWNLDEIIDDFSTIKTKIMEIKEKTVSSVVKQPSFSSVVPSSSKPTENTVVGFDTELIRVMEQLMSHEPARKIIPIVGMAGIGKTTLARSGYENRTIIDYFDIRAWVTITQNYSTRSIFLEVLSCLRKLEGDENSAALSRDVDGKSEDELKLVVYQSLIARRYLIVMDDMWSVDAWDEIKFHFPNDKNKSRIIITTRHSNLANRLTSYNGGLTLNLLDDERSWALFREKVFGRERCPLVLEAIGKKIVRKCKGLPLSISVVGRFLAKSSKAVEHWEKVAEEISSILNSGDENDYSNILNLSYSYLPAHLKPCFLYIGIFPEDHEILVSRLVKLWIAEGFLKPIKGKDLKEVAECYIEDLVDRNLILVRRWGSNGKIRTCTIHDALRDLCLRISHKQRFHRVLRSSLNPETQQGMENERRVVINPSDTDTEINSEVYNSLHSLSFVRSLICNVETNDDHRRSCSSRLLRVLSWEGRYSSENLFELSNLRYLSCIPSSILNSTLPSTISLFWNVQTLDFKGYWEQIVVPPEIWKMPQLRHVEFDDISLPEPPLGNGKDDLVLKNLSTLLTVANFRCSEGVLKRIPNIRKLHVIYDDFSGVNETGSEYCLKNLRNLTNLESLSCSFRNMPVSRDLLQNIIFPNLLKKLTLKGCMIPWEDLTIIGSLPHLEVLKLETNAATGSEWNPVEGEFLSLKFLKICFCYLENWEADNSHFPALQSLVLEYLYYLNEIPSGIGDIMTLRKIQIGYCSDSTVSSGQRILEEQQVNGNMDIQLQVKSSETTDVASMQYSNLSPGFSVIEELGDFFTTF